MNPREKTLSLVLLGAIVLVVAGAGGYFLVWQPLQEQRAAEEALNQEIGDLEKQVQAQRQAAKRLAEARVRSLPSDIEMARREYHAALERLIESAGVPKGYTVYPKSVDNSSRAVPELSKGKPIYTRVAHEIILKKVDTWMLKDFLERYYRLGLLHQITNITIKKDDDPSSKNAGRRNDLTVTVHTEAILVDGAENRRTLLPVPTAFAAVGGGALYKGMTASPQAGRGVVSALPAATLAPQNRDYSLIVRKDPFSGPLADPPSVPFKLDKIADVKIKTDATPDAVKVRVAGDGSTGATVTAVVDGTLFAKGALKVDPKTLAIELPKTSATEGTATVSVVATSADGSKTEKASFRVSLAEVPPPPAPTPGEDLSGVILLIGVSPRSDGTAWARVVDNANRHRYQIDATPTGVTVRKESTYGPGRPWKSDTDHEKLPAGVMQVPDTTKTTRTFKVVAVNSDGLVVADMKPGTSAPRSEPMRGGPPRAVKQGPANPLAAVGGNMIATAPPPKYYRWEVGQALSGIKPLSDAEVKEILKTAEANGPVFDIADSR